MEKVETPKRKLTKKQRGFVKDYVATGNGTKAALNNYDTKKEVVAANIASENLRKPYIAQTIAEALPDELLAERHLELLNKREVYKIGSGDAMEYEMSDQPDTQAVKAGLDMAYKLKGSYAPEKHDNRNVNVDLSKRDLITKVALEVIEKLKDAEDIE